MYDIIVSGGTIVDGSGGSRIRNDVGILNGKIQTVGNLRDAPSKRRINTGGLIVAPGFVDMHTHSDLAIMSKPPAETKIRQGVTSEVIGNCGLSVAPNRKGSLESLKRYVSAAVSFPEIVWTWESFEDYLRCIQTARSVGNVAPLVAQGALRIAVMGFSDKDARATELADMKRLLKESLEAGALGMSSGLLYPPGCYTSREEMTELCKVVAEDHGVYATHIRNEGDYLVESLSDAIRIARDSGVSVHISHHKAAGRANWGKVKHTVRMIDEARREGLSITCDVYPYSAGGNFLTSILPKWTLEGGIERLVERLRDASLRERIREEFTKDIPGWENFVKLIGWQNICLNSIPDGINKRFEGKRISEIAELKREPPADVAMDLIAEERGNIGIIFFNIMSEEDIEYIAKQEFTMFGSDGLYTLPGTRPHPRLYGTFPRILSEYVRKRKTLTLEEAIRKMTLLPCQRLGLRERGQVRAGYDADIVVFDEDGIQDRATYEDPCLYPVGIHFVMVNGEIVLEGGQYTGKLPGRVLRGGAA